jgi:hypothetical protein
MYIDLRCPLQRLHEASLMGMSVCCCCCYSVQMSSSPVQVYKSLVSS